MDFLQRPIAEQAKLLAAMRIQTGGEGGAHSRELAEKVRPKLEDLERHPADFAEFQSSFIEAAAKIEDPSETFTNSRHYSDHLRAGNCGRPGRSITSAGGGRDLGSATRCPRPSRHQGSTGAANQGGARPIRSALFRRHGN